MGPRFRGDDERGWAALCYPSSALCDRDLAALANRLSCAIMTPEACLQALAKV